MGDETRDERVQRERMLVGDLYLADDPQLAQEVTRSLPAGVVAYGDPAWVARSV